MKVVGKKHYKQYTLKQVLGQGAFGKVYYSPPYAIKQMNLSGMSQFIANTLKNEIIHLNKINHPNVVRLLDHFYEGACVYLVLEYCEQDLSKFLKKNKCTEKMALSIFRQLLLGFRELVNQGIIHRDLKPANILLNSRNQFKLADFGFSKFVDHYDSKLLTTIVGTPMYMSPQLLSGTQYTTKSDIWSMGVILYEMLTGYPPWTGHSESDLCKNVHKVPLALPKNVSAFTKDLLVRMLKVNEKDRIGWQELFGLVLASNNMSPEKPRPQTSRQAKQPQPQNKQNPQRSPSRKKVFPQTPEQRAKSNKKSDPQARQNLLNLQKQSKQSKQSKQTKQTKQTQKISLSEEMIKQIFLLEIQRNAGEEECRKLAEKQFHGMTSGQKELFERALANFNQEFQRAVRTIFKGGLK